MSVIMGEYVTFKHIKTRKVVVLEIEVPEENFQSVITSLGMPVGGESKPVGVALLDKSVINKPEPKEQTEGEKLRTRAVLLCKDEKFQKYMSYNHVLFYEINLESAPLDEHVAKELLCDWCDIKSRSELTTNIQAQEKFKAISRSFEDWLNPVDEQYKDNLERV